MTKLVFRRQFIPQLSEKLRARTYLEVGVKGGRTFSCINASRKIGVDPAFRIKPVDRWMARLNPVHTAHFYEMTSDQFFDGPAARLFARRKIDLAFVDGLHTWEQSLRDVDNVVRYLAPNGIIVLHDCSPDNPLAATPAQSIEHAKTLNPKDWDGRWCGDVWKTVISIRALRPELEIRVIDLDSGLGIIRVAKSATMLPLNQAAIEKLTYEEMAADRERWLNLTSAEQVLKSVG